MQDDDQHDFLRFWKGALLGGLIGAPFTVALIWGLWIIGVAITGGE